MIEPIMYSGIGFLAAAVFGLLAVRLVHGRAVRLTLRRLEAAIPTSISEIRADKDHLRAEFSMATRHLELTIEKLKTKSFGQIAELGKKNEAMDRLKMELGEKSATNFALEARDKVLRDQLRAAEEEISFKTNAMYDAQRAHSEKAAELATLKGEFDECSKLANSQKHEIIALTAKVEATKTRDEILLYVMGKHAVHQGNGHDGAYLPISVDLSPED